MKPASQTGLKLPFMAELLPRAYAGDERRPAVRPRPRPTSCSTRRATRRAPTASAPTPTERPLALNFSVQAGFIDFQALADVVVEGLTPRARRQGHPDRAGVGGRGRRSPATSRCSSTSPARRLRHRPEPRGEALQRRRSPTQDRRPAQRRTLERPGRPTRSSTKLDQRHGQGPAEGARRPAGRHHDEAVAGDRPDLRAERGPATAPTRPSAGRASRTRTRNPADDKLV